MGQYCSVKSRGVRVACPYKGKKCLTEQYWEVGGVEENRYKLFLPISPSPSPQPPVASPHYVPIQILIQQEESNDR